MKYLLPLQYDEERQRRKRPLSQGERRTSRKVEPIAYEEAADDVVADDEEEDYDNPVLQPPSKKMKLLPSPNAKKRKRPTFSSKKKRPPPRSAKQISKQPAAVAKKKRVAVKVVGGQKFDFEDGFKKENFSPKLELKKLTIQELIQAGVKMDTVKYYPEKNKGHKNKKKVSVPPPKSILRRPSKKVKDCPTTDTNLEPTREFTHIERNVHSDQRIHFEATPCQVHSSPSPIGIQPIHWKEDKPNQMLNTYSNIKTQGDMIVAMIKAVLPSLPSDKVSQIYDYLADMGVENAGDLAFIEEDDLNRILKPIQSRKLIAAWKNKGVPSHNTSLPRRTTCSSEPVTFVPAVFQIQNMASQNQINDNPKVFSPPSDTQNRSTVMQAINIPGWRQSVPPPSVQDVYPDLSCTNTDVKLVKEASLPLSPPPKDWTDSFEIPWEKLPLAVENCLLKKQRPSKNARVQIVHTVCKKIFQVAKYPMKSQLETIARKMCNRFPESLCDEGQPGNECELLRRQLANRITTLRKGKTLEAKLPEDEEQDQWLSERYSEKLGDKSNSSSFASTVPSAVSYTSSMSSSKSYTSAASSAMSSSSPSYNSVILSDKSYISSAASNPSFSLTQSDDTNVSAGSVFAIPWHKLDSDILNVLHKRKKLSVLQKQTVTRIVCDEFAQWHPEPYYKTEESRKIAKQMHQAFPSSLSNAAFGEAGGNRSSSYLAGSLKRRMHNMVRYKKKNAEKEAASGSRIKKPPAQIDSSGVLDWAINFRIPWEKLPNHLLECLRKRERPTPTLRQEMVRILSNDIQTVEENPNKESVDFVAKKVCKAYPKSLCDMSGDRVGTSHEFLGRELLWRIQRINYASKSLVRQETLNSGGSLSTFAESDNMNQFVDVNSMDISSMNDRDAPMYFDPRYNTNFGMNTVTYSETLGDTRNDISDYDGTGTSTFYDDGNNFTPLNYITQLEQLIKKEVSEQDPRFNTQMTEEFEKRN